MTEIEHRLAAVPAEDLPPTDLDAVRQRARGDRRRQRFTAGIGLGALVAISAVAATSLLGGNGTQQVADSTPSTDGSEVRTGTWRLADPDSVTVSDTDISIVVEQVEGGCGSSFRAHQPSFTLGDDRIIVTVTGDYTPPEPDVVHTCQGTAQQISLELPEAIGERLLVDGYDDGIRWQPPIKGDPSFWAVSDPASVTPDSTVLEVEVTRNSCSSGFTGEVMGAEVSYTPDAVLIRTLVEPLDRDAPYMCPGNPPVPYTIELREPVGERLLLDVLCQSEPESGNAYCLDGGIRWQP